MRKLSLVGLVAAIITLPARPEAQVSLGLRVGFGFPMGDAVAVEGIESFSEKDLFKWELPLQADLSYRFTHHLSAGVYYSYAFPFEGTRLKDFCDVAGASCSKLYDQRFGIQAEYDLTPRGQLDPWIAVGTGMDIAHFKVKGFSFLTPLGPAAGDLEGTLRGWEWFNVQLGVDYRSSDSFALGPYVQYSMGRYTVQQFKLAGETVASDGISNPKTHEWLTVGIRGKFGG